MANDPMITFNDLPESLKNKIFPPRQLTSREVSMTLGLMNPDNVASKKFATPADEARAARALRRQGVQLPLSPVTNRGGKSKEHDLAGLPSFEAREILKEYLIDDNGKTTRIFIPKKDNRFKPTIAFVDWVTFTFKTSNHIPRLPQHGILTDEDYVKAFSKDLENIFGFGATNKLPKGINFYHEAWELGENSSGYVCIGGQKESVCVLLNGQGLAAARVGWERRLYDFLNQVPNAKITRLDLANDNFNSDITIDDYLLMYHADLFKMRGRPPEIQQAGNWLKPNGKGRTLYVGSRTSGKLLRIYEKGLQLARGFESEYPNWLRVELELKAIDRVIPFDALLKPGQYLAGAYPALAFLHKDQTKIQTYKKTVQATFKASLEIFRQQYGKYLWLFTELFGQEIAFQKITKNKQQIPKRLNFSTYEQFCKENQLHYQPVIRSQLEALRI